MSKKFLILIGITFLLFLVLLILLFSQKKEKGEKQPVIPQPTRPVVIPTSETGNVFPTIILGIPPSDKVIISGITVNNFFKNASQINTYGDVLIVDTVDYQIVYQAKFNTFLLSILSSPFDKVRVRGENELVRILGVTEANACRLSVSLTTPEFANPQEAGREYRLSFCR